MAASLRQLIPSSVRQDLKRVEERLNEVLSRGSERLREPAAVTLSAGGKRLRPALVLLCAYKWESDNGARASGNGLRARMRAMSGFRAGTSPNPVDAACAVELIHMGSLVHDDIVDENSSRRGRETVVSRWGEHNAVCVGDFLFAQSFRLLSGYGDSTVAQIVADTVCEMGSGELEQLEAVNRPDSGIESYMEKIRKKTAVLFAASCELGGLCAGVSDKERVALRSYGEKLGMAFQIYDDILDFVADEKELGKPRGTDLKEGNVTLPVIYALQDGGEAVGPAIGSKDRAVVAAGVQAVLAGPGIPSAKVHAGEMVAQAKEHARSIASPGLRTNLIDLADYVIERVN